jgi:hypothetical protein
MRYRWLLILFVAVPQSAIAQTAQQSAAASVQYLARVMDEYHGRFPVYDDVSSGGNHFHAYAIIPEGAHVEMNGSWTATKHSGATAIRCEYHADSPDGFGGFYLQNGTLTGTQTKPVANFGTVPNAGMDLTGATTLRFWARGHSGGEQVEFFLAGVGHEPSPQPYPDSSERRPSQGTLTALTTQWTQYSIDLTGMDLSYVLGGFGWVADTEHNPSGGVFYLDDIEYVLSADARNQRLNQPRFIRSFTTLPNQPDVTDGNKDDDIDFVLRNCAFTYDNALAVLAFLADGSTDSLRRGRLIGDAFVRAIQHDVRFNDNRACNAAVSPLTDDGARLRSAYAAGDVALPPGWTPNGRSGTLPLPGFYLESNQTFYVVEQNAVDSGNNAWAVIALLALHQRTSEPSYLETACRLGNFIHAFRGGEGTYQGFTGGVNYPDEAPPSLRSWASSEHNLDIYAAFSRLHAITGDARWLDDAGHAQTFVEAMWNGAGHCYLAGTTDPSTRNSNSGQLPLDVQAWSVLSLPNALATHPGVLDCAEANHFATSNGFSGFDFNEDKDGVWFEGTAQMAAAYAFAGETANAEIHRQTLRSAQQAAEHADGEGLVASGIDGLTTGFDTPRGDPFKYFKRLHTGATSWNVFAQLGINPYYQSLAAPASLEAHFNGSAGVIAWNAVPGATGYEVSRSDGLTFTAASASALDAAAIAGSAYLYRVRATRSGTMSSAWSAPELMTAVTFTDDPLMTFQTIAKAVHVTQLRSAVNSVRALASLAPVTFTDPSLALAPIRVLHIIELRTALAAARASLTLSPLSFAHPALQANMSPLTSTDIAELRAGVR